MIPLKSICFVIAFALAVCRPAPAAVYTFDYTGINTAIPDGNVNGISDTRTVADLTGRSAGAINDVNVTLNVSGGYNGDLYAYLVHNSGFAVLLNRVGRTAGDGFGYDNTGLAITFDDSAATDVHGYQTVAYTVIGGQLTGTWRPDGRTTDPATVVDTDARTALLGSFNGGDPNGSWTLFLSDMVDGEQGTLMGWQLQISTVPEPVLVALIVFASLAISIKTFLAVRARNRKKQKLPYQMYYSVS